MRISSQIKLAVALSLSGCAFLQVESNFTAKSTPLKIAVLYDETSMDVKCAISREIAIRGHTVENVKVEFLRYESSASSIDRLMKKVKKESFDAVVGPILSSDAHLSARSLATSDIVQILPIATEPKIYHQFPDVIPMLPSASQYAKLLGTRISTEKKFENIIIYYNDSVDYSISYKNLLTNQLLTDGYLGKIISIKTSELSTIAIKGGPFSSASKTFIYAPVYAVDLSRLFFMVKNLEGQFEIFTHAGIYEAQPLIQPHMESRIDVTFNGIWDKSNSSNPTRFFSQTSRDRCGPIRIKPWSYAVWESILLVSEAHKNHPQLRGRDLSLAIKSQKFSGILGRWTLNEQGFPKRNLAVYRLTKDGSNLAHVIKHDSSPYNDRAD